MRDAESTGPCVQRVHISPERRLYWWWMRIKRIYAALKGRRERDIVRPPASIQITLELQTATVNLIPRCKKSVRVPQKSRGNADLYLTRPEWAVISPPLFHHWSRCRQEWLLSDWGVLLLDVIMNIAVVIYSRHLSRWRCSGLRLFVKGMRPAICLNAFVSRESFVIQLHLQKKWV